MNKVKVPTLEELLEAGVHFGHQIRRSNPKMRSYIYGARDGVHILDLTKSSELLEVATQAAYDFGKANKVLLIVATKKQARVIVEGLAKEAETPYITSHWIGGLLTNFDEIRKNLKKLNDLKVEKEKGGLSHYTKKEQLLIDRKLQKYLMEFGGIADMNQPPDALFLVDTVTEINAVKEAKRMGLPIIGVADTNSDPYPLTYPIPANDDGIKAIKLITETIIHSYAEGKKEAVIVAAKEKVDKEALDKKTAEDAAAALLAPVDAAVADETAALEEVIEKATIEDSSRKIE